MKKPFVIMLMGDINTKKIGNGYEEVSTDLSLINAARMPDEDLLVILGNAMVSVIKNSESHIDLNDVFSVIKGQN